MRPFRQKTIIEAVDKASKVINKIYTSAKKMSTGITKESKIAGGAFNRFTTSIGMNVKKASVSLNNLNARINRVGYNIKKSLGTLGLAVGFTALAMGVGGVIKTFATYEQANAGLASVMGKTIEQNELLIEDSKRLGAITAKTATEVVGLQEAYARLGFGERAILDMTEATISGSVAMKGELADTAELVGAMVKSFDQFESVNASEIIDKLTKSTQASALNFEKLQTGLPVVAGAANAAKVPFTKLLASMGKLSDAGIDASSSSTALRNIFLEAAKQGKPYEQLLLKVANSTDKLKVANELFGKRGAVAAVILAKNIEKVNELDKSLQSAAGTAGTAAAKQLDTLTGSVTILGSAWEGYILSIEDGKGAIGGFLKDTVRMATEVLSIATGTQKLTKDMTDAELRIRGFAETAIKVLKVIKAATIAFMAFKAVVVALRVATFAYNVVLGVQSALLGAMHISMKANTVAMTAMAIASKVIAAATWVYNTAMAPAIAATWAFAAALWATGIPEIVIGIAALVAGIVLLVKHWDIVSAAFNKFYDKVKASPFQILIHPIMVIIDLIKVVVDSFRMIRDSFKFGSLADGFKAIGMSILNFLISPIKTLLEGLAAIPGVGKLAQKGLDALNKFQDKQIKGVEELKKSGQAEIKQVATIEKTDYVTRNITNEVDNNVTPFEAFKNETSLTSTINETTKNKVIENEAIKTDASDKLTDAILLNAKITGENTEIQKAKAGEWKGKFQTYIAKDANITERNITSELAKTAINNENNVITKQSELLNKTAVNESNILNNSENNIINKTSLKESNINKSTEIVKNLVNESNFIQSDIIKENEITKNVANVTNTDFVTQRDLVEQKDVENVRNESNISNQTNKNNQNEGGKITINVVDKTGGNYALEVESTGVNVITTGNG